VHARLSLCKEFFYGTNVTPALGERETPWPEKGNPKRPKRAIGGSRVDFDYAFVLYFQGPLYFRSIRNAM
jgi:hypothetical protein